MVAGETLLWAQLGVLVLQLVLLVVSACLIWKYVQSTRNQIEAMSRPVLVPRQGGGGLRLINVGSGPALKVEWWPVSQDEPFRAPNNVDPHGYVGVIEAKGDEPMAGSQDFRSLMGHWKIVCRYRSISGRVYLSQGIPREDPVSGERFDSETIEEARP